MAEIFTSATQPLSHSGRVAEWLSGWLLQPLWRSGWVAECLSVWVAEWLLQPLWQSGWVAASATLAEWLSGCSSHSGRVAEWLHQPLWHSGWVAEWLRQSHQSMKWTDKVLNISISKQEYIYDIDSNLIYKHNRVNFNCHSYITSTDWLRTATYTLWTITWNHLKRKIVVMNSTSSGLETTITTTIWWAKNGYGVL